MRDLRVKLDEICTKTESDQLHHDLTECLAQLQRAAVGLDIASYHLKWQLLLSPLTYRVMLMNVILSLSLRNLMKELIRSESNVSLWSIDMHEPCKQFLEIYNNSHDTHIVKTVCNYSAILANSYLFHRTFRIRKRRFQKCMLASYRMDGGYFFCMHPLDGAS